MKSSGSEQLGVDFSGLVLGFSSAALSYMGFNADGVKVEKNLDLARQNIGIIELLCDKTKGNLSADEKQLTEQILEDLRKKFSEASA